MGFSRVSGNLLACLWLCTVSSVCSYGQSDTIQLEQVIIETSSSSSYLPGGKQVVLKTDSMVTGNLVQLIENQLPVYFIQYGAVGQLASINLRGLGAYRTSVRWEGMEINSFTLGQTDFSEIAAGTSSEISIQFGGVGSMFGNGALGGTVDIENKPVYHKGHGLSFTSTIGSYGYLAGNLDYRYSGGMISSTTRIYRRQAENNFSYQLSGTGYRQKNASFVHYGLVQDFFYRLKHNHQLSLHFWYNNHFREIQPNMNDFTSDEELDTENTRLALAWDWMGGSWTGTLSAGFTNDFQLYDNNELTRLSRWFASYHAEWARSRDLTLRFGGNINYLKPEADAYQGNQHETRSELYASALWEGIDHLSVGLSFRTPMLNGDIKTFTPLLSASYLILRSARARITAEVQAGSSYRLPTMNDIYWQPGGNPGLKPETSRNIEAGAGLALTGEKVSWDLKLNAFRHAVDNWILWIPGGRDETPEGEVISFWYPDNIREVLATGIEYHNQLSWKLPKNGVSTQIGINGTFNRAENRNTLSPGDRSRGKQLPYTPEHILNANWNLNYRSWNLGITTQYRGKRYTEANNELPPLPAYTLWNLATGTHGTMGSLNWGLSFQVYNLFDQNYQTFENRAMPGRNYMISLRLTTNYEQ